MKRFGSLLAAAVLGSAITLFTTQWYHPGNEGVKIEHVSGVPSSQVAYKVNENGEIVPLDFTGVAEKVTKAVVHIRSISEGQVTRDRNEDPIDPFQVFNPGQPPMRRGPSHASGTGVVINSDGYIVTNNHLVQHAAVLEFTL